ncbi:hypothetical protein [Catellatospora sp. IY07-71]|uniref:hypothetical protein n=1 Tax=Catellatospora sp. IY07-71 TaxID=2728827 RepID=UPI001BB35F69|nr:hypothetical protein [Catellatospora sp. IY07-71]
MSRRGVYFVANDAVLDQAIAFLNSFRAHNPTIALCLIPYDDDVSGLVRLAGEYDFGIWSDDDTLAWCDGVSRRFHDRTVGQYRKLAMWEGPFDEFVYIDTDTVVLTDIGFVFAHLADFGFVASHSNLPQIRKWVWKDSIYDAQVLTGRQIAYAANTGFLVSRRQCLPRTAVDERLPAAVALAEHMELYCCEQPLLNYLIVTSGIRHGSLMTIAAKTRSWHIPMERWAGDPSYVVEDGRVVVPDTPHLLMHWAGEWARARDTGAQIPYFALWNHYRRLRDPQETR